MVAGLGTTLRRAAGGGWGHLLSCVNLFSVSLVLKAVKSFFYLLLITSLLCLLILFSLGKLLEHLPWLSSLGLCGVALLGTVLAVPMAHLSSPPPAAVEQVPYTSCSRRACQRSP